MFFFRNLGFQLSHFFVNLVSKINFAISFMFLNRSILTTSKTVRQILRQKVNQRISAMEKGFQIIDNSIHVLSLLKTTKTPLFVFITEILWWTLCCNNWRSIFDSVKILRFTDESVVLSSTQLTHQKIKGKKNKNRI